MQLADAAFEPGEPFGGSARADIDLVEIVAGGRIDQAGAENRGVIFLQAAPEIREIDGVERFARSEAQRLDLRASKRRGSDSHGQLGMRGGSEIGESQRLGVSREEDAARANNSGNGFAAAANAYFEQHAARDLGLCRAPDNVLVALHRREFEREDFGMLDDLRAGGLRGARQASDNLARVDRAARNFFHGAQLAGIAPANRRVAQTRFAPEFPHAGQGDFSVDLERAQNALVAAEHVAKSGKLAGRGFGQSHAAGAAARAIAQRAALEQENGFRGSEFAQPRRGGEAAETSAHDDEIRVARNGSQRGTELDPPWRSTPFVRAMALVGHRASWMRRDALCAQGAANI